MYYRMIPSLNDHAVRKGGKDEQINTPQKYVNIISQAIHLINNNNFSSCAS